jgi:hypothetical protein
VTSQLLRRQTGIELNLEGFDLEHISFDGRILYRNPFSGARLADDDLSVATALDRMGAWTRGDCPPPYPLADACQDHLISLAILESLETRNAAKTGVETWAR